MQETEATQQTAGTSAARHLLSARWIFLAVVALLLLLLAIVAPLISVNRYKHRISTSIGASLGRPVHFDQVTLNLIPVPSFTITNFVVEEDPAFGAEPIIRANTVDATLRVSSLWRKRVEFSRIRFTEPSINLVHDGRGKWNIESILLQAAQIDTAPTAQPTPGTTPRFPYIEATGARLNLKNGVEKTPFSLSEADFALWLPDPREWKMRMEARPIRTDTSVSETGTLQLEATLGRASSLETVPLDLEATWRGAPLGEATRLILARDLGLRGEIVLTAKVHGNLNRNSLQTRLEITRLHRSDFVPQQAVSLDLSCTAVAGEVFHSFTDLRCMWPISDSDGATLALAGSVPDVLRLGDADLQVGAAKLPAATLLNWLRVASSQVPPSLSAKGLLSGSVSHESGDGALWTGQATLPELRLSGSSLGSAPLAISGLLLSTDSPAADHRSGQANRWFLPAVGLPLGGKEPALLEGSADAGGYVLHLTGMIVLSRLLAVASAVPQLGEGLSAVLPTDRAPGPVRLDLSARRAWGAPQVWTDNFAHPVSPSSHAGRPGVGRPGVRQKPR